MGKYTIYVIELDDPKTVYVGLTGLSPEERLEKHKIGYKSSKYVRRAKNPFLRPDIYEQIPNITSHEDALKVEANLAENLRKIGYTVYGGH